MEDLRTRVRSPPPPPTQKKGPPKKVGPFFVFMKRGNRSLKRRVRQIGRTADLDACFASAPEGGEAHGWAESCPPPGRNLPARQYPKTSRVRPFARSEWDRRRRWYASPAEGLGPWMAPSPARRRPVTTYRAHSPSQSGSTNRRAADLDACSASAGAPAQPKR